MKTLSIIIPVYNEKSSIIKLLNFVDSAPTPDLIKEIIIIDDGSTDGTKKLLETFVEKYRIIFKDKNEGKGSAIRRGFIECTGDYVLVQDADLEYSPDEYPKLLKLLQDGTADVVFGSRFINGKPKNNIYIRHYYGNRFLTMFSNIFTKFKLTDMETCYKVFTRKALDTFKNDLEANRFGIEPEITAMVSKNNLRIAEVGISYYGRTYKEGKKIKWRDGVSAMWHIIKYNIS